MAQATQIGTAATTTTAAAATAAPLALVGADLRARLLRSADVSDDGRNLRIVEKSRVKGLRVLGFWPVVQDVGDGGGDGGMDGDGL